MELCEGMFVSISYCRLCRKEFNKWEEHKIHLDNFWKAAYGATSIIQCENCGDKNKGVLITDRDVDDNVYCRNFIVTIAGKRRSFCTTQWVCNNCFHVQWARPAVTLSCGHLRVYPPTNIRCGMKSHQPPNVAKERNMRCQS